MKIGLFAATNKGYTVTKKLYEKGMGEEIAFVCSFEEVDVSDSYTQKIRDFCLCNSITYFEWSEIKNRLTETLKEQETEIAFAISWKYIISLNINSVLKVPLIVFHDSLLPRYRGFAPTPTAMINQEEKIGYSALFAVDEMDKGEIVLQRELRLYGDEYVAEVIEKLGLLLPDMIIDIVSRAKEEKLFGIPQNEELATYSAWRDIEDCQIDWNLSSNEIYASVRALSKPYMGAFTFLHGKKIIIEKALPVLDVNFEIRYPGKLWQVSNNEATVICGKGMLRIQKAVYEDGSMVEFNKLRTRLG